MTYEEIQRQVVAVLPSEGLRQEIDRTGHVFTPPELLKLAQRYAPDQAKRMELLTLLAEGVPTMSAHARAIVAHERKNLAAFTAGQEDAVFELVVDEEGVSVPTRYLCADWAAALARLRWYQAEYADYLEETDRYTIEKRRILPAEDTADSDMLGWCHVDAAGCVLSVDMEDGGNEWGACDRECDGCPHRCLNRMDEPACPMFIGAWDFVRYSGLRGWPAWGIAVPQEVPGALETEVMVYQLNERTVHLRDLDDAALCHWHAALPEVEVIQAHELPAWMQEDAAAYRAWLMEQMDL